MKLNLRQGLLSVAVAAGLLCRLDEAAAFSLQKMATDKDNQVERVAPTTIVSDSMDIDFQNNVSVFTGNVEVDDPAIKINCHKMTIYLADKLPGAGDADKDGKKKGKDGDDTFGGGGGKELKKIVCIGDVVIVRKLAKPEDMEKGEQRATAGRADYDVKAEMIVLTENNPTIERGKDKLSGSRITLWLDSERLKVEGGNTGDSRAKINVENLKEMNKGLNK